MALSVFDNPAVRPTEQAIEEKLGRAASAWKSLRKNVSGNGSPLLEEWAFAGAKFGWSLRVKRATRVVVYLTPCEGHFLASFALGERACAEASRAGLPAGMLALIANAPKYAEGRGVRIPVWNRKDAEAIQKLAAIKMARMAR